MRRRATIDKQKFGYQKQNGLYQKLKAYVFAFYIRQFNLHTVIIGQEITYLNFLITILSYLQVLSIPFTQYKKINQQSLLLQILFYASRPSAYLADQMDDDSNIICLVLSNIFIVFVIIILLFVENRTIRRIINYCFTYYNHYAYIILLEIGYLQLLPYNSNYNSTIQNWSNTSTIIQTNYKILNQNPIQALFGVLLIFLCSLTSFYQLQFSDINVNIYESGLSRMQSSYEYVISQLVKHLIVLTLYMDFYDSNGGMLISILLSSIYFYFITKDMLINIPYSDYSQNILIIGIVVGEFLQCYFDTMNQKTFIVISILVLPISCMCTLNYFKNRFINIVIFSIFQGNNKESNQSEFINYFALQLAFFTRNRMSLFKNRNYKMLILCKYEQHMLQCKNPICQCKNLQKMIGIQEGNFEVNACLIDQFLINSCQEILDSKRYIISSSLKQQFFVLIMFMIQHKKNLFSLQRVIEILCQKQELQISLNTKIIRGIWFRAGLNVLLDFIHQSMDECFLTKINNIEFKIYRPLIFIVFILHPILQRINGFEIHLTNKTLQNIKIDKNQI